MEVTDKASELTCVVCCSSHPNDFAFEGNHERTTTKGGLKRNGRKDQHQPCQEKPDLVFRNFCRELLSIRRLELGRDLSVCSSCVGNIGLVLESKSKVDKVEARVRKLQMSLLVELRGLEAHVEGLEEHMKRIEDCVKGSDETRLGIHFKKVKIPSDIERNDALLFRQCLSNVSKDFRSFRNELRRKVLLDQVNRTSTSQPTSDPIDSITHSNHCKEILAEVKIEAEDEAIPMEPEGLEDFDSLSLLPLQVEKSEHALLSSEEDISDTFCPPQQLEDDFQSPISPPPTSTKRLKKRKAYRSAQLANIQLKGMSDFKKYVIKHLVLSAGPPRTKDKSNPDDDDNVGDCAVAEVLRNIRLDRTLTPVEFNQDKDSFHFKGVEILINEQTKTLQCSKCRFSIKPKWKRKKSESPYELKRVIKNHVMGQHMNAFQCPICDTKYTFYKSFCRHLHSHLKPHSCPVCGRPLASSKGIELHMWTHKSAEEKAEAIAMEEDKRPVRASTSEDVRFQCSTCGKYFKENKYLIIHEKRHQSSPFYEKILCPDCGKYIPKLKYRYHKENVCLPEGTPWVQCIHCERSFQTIAKMQVHLKRTHTREAIERPHQCDICHPSRNFKSLSELKVHMKIHSEVRPFQCTKGCGRDFAVKRNWKRHEEKCKGFGRRNRKNRMLFENMM